MIYTAFISIKTSGGFFHFPFQFSFFFLNKIVFLFLDNIFQLFFIFNFFFVVQQRIALKFFLYFPRVIAFFFYGKIFENFCNMHKCIFIVGGYKNKLFKLNAYSLWYSWITRENIQIYFLFIQRVEGKYRLKYISYKLNRYINYLKERQKR